MPATRNPATKNIDYLKHLSKISKSGVTCLRGLSHGKCVYTRYRNDIKDLVNHANNDKVNWFDTINDFTRAKYDHHYHASKACVSGLRGVWIDIDLKLWVPRIERDLTCNKEIKNEFYYGILFKLLKFAQLPQPTAIDDSGYGFHLFWLFDKRVPVRRNRENLISMWQRTVESMLGRFNKSCLHYDKYNGSYPNPESRIPAIGDKNNSCNIAKLMRMPTTFNRKNGNKVLCHTVFQSGKTYSLIYLYKKYSQVETYENYKKYRQQAQRKYDEKGKRWDKIKKKHYIANGKKWAKENARAKKRHQRYLYFKHHTKIIWGKNRYTLYIARCQDILHLVKSRHGKMINFYKKKRCYELTLFLYAVNYVHLSHDKHISYNLTKCLSDLNNKFCKPLQPYYLDKIIKEARQPAFLGYGYPMYSGKDAKYSKVYLKNSWYITALGITPDEMKSLKTLINPTEKEARRKSAQPRKQRNRRIKRQRKSKRSGAKFKRHKRNVLIIKLHRKGLSERKIVKSMNNVYKIKVSKRTIVTVIKRSKGGAIF